MTLRIMMFGMTMGAALLACGDDAEKGNDATITTDATSATDSTTTTSDPDTTAATDTAEPDTTEPDTTAATDTTEPDTTEPDTTEETCGCEGGASCLQARTAESCASLSTTCGGGLHRVDACDLGEVMAACERTNTIQYHYWARIDGWLQDAKDSCADTLVGAGVFTVAEIPAGVGDVCSCQRTTASCVQTYGAACDTLTCDAPEGKQAAACTDVGTIPGRCVTRDGQRELVFYSAGATAEQAEMSCHGASANAYYWFPAGL